MSTEKKDDRFLIAQLAARIYQSHIHAGRPYATFEHALHGAAVLVGAAQSPATDALIEQAKANPAEALQKLRQSEHFVADQVDKGRERQISDLVRAIRTEGQ